MPGRAHRQHGFIAGPGFPGENNLRMFTTLIYSAQHRVSITSPYFVPDESLLYAMTTAAQRGVAIELPLRNIILR